MIFKPEIASQAVLEHTFNLNSREAEAGGAL